MLAKCDWGTEVCETQSLFLNAAKNVTSEGAANTWLKVSLPTQERCQLDIIDLCAITMADLLFCFFENQTKQKKQMGIHGNSSTRC